LSCCVGGYYVGVPIILGAGGVERIVELELSPAERADFQKSVDSVKQLVSIMDSMLGRAGNASTADNGETAQQGSPPADS
jgi:hypothetical protein